ncbi:MULTISPECIES: serine hydrolase [Oceanobacillus]|uniref:serine-type D-Ala-D-Ala carboxypeptidase n=1 Tax=Oceanobacillus kimchii TaxID=746691 RepID=A0ABQ5TIC3_9BACI|nr:MULTISPECIES: serine hydrolase [Oceanobacillus]MBT2599885.1 D-alanyl-D-alanine carboxypeptidase [Oceanobacillus sp. ISL-74]MBT2652665.1 D-alanyl-D-alanine carboxypeptidase [Oceanobacillus sp. ISL-73]GLO64227.1 D-alanyl-D-alanine carboxypeptidase DacA [Oceanobacillus kimchii]
MRNKLNKVLLLAVASILVFTSMLTATTTVQANELDLVSESAILVDGETGKVLYAKNPDVALPPASMTKMMTEYLVWEAIENGNITWDTTTEISDYPYSISANNSFSGVGLKQQQEYTVKELYEAMAINSDNATTIALAELIAGSESEFVKMMNEKGEEMGLQEFKFVNSTGLDNEDLGDNYPEGTNPNDTNLLSARSAALLAYHLVNDYEEALEISSIPQTTFGGQTINNWNYMLPHEGENLASYYYEGVDGLKTGFTDLAGYSFTGTAERNGQRLITVVMKTGSETERFEETAKLLDYGFSNFENTELFSAGYQEEGNETVPVAKGKEDQVSISLQDSVSVPIKADEKDLYHLEYNIDQDRLNEDGELIAPIEANEAIGTAKLVYDGETEDYGYISDAGSNTGEFTLVTNEAVEKSNWFMLTLQAIGDFFVNIFTSAVDWIKGLFS